MKSFPIQTEKEIGLQNQSIDLTTLNKLRKVNESYIVKILIKEVIEESKIEDLIIDYTDLELECDGLTRVISYILKKNNIDHKTCIGYISYKDKGIEHFWIELPNGQYIDYRAQMWLGTSKDIPNGIFNPKDYPKVKYECDEKVNLNVDRFTFEILSSSFND